jgi:tetratricopeptide (TPR) repeat protein
MPGAGSRSALTSVAPPLSVRALTPDEWDEVKRLFEEALALPVETRSEWSARACGDRESVARELSSLLAAHERAGSFLNTRSTAPLLGDLADETLVGTRLGPYVLEAVLGCGGMGVVYRARRREPDREVAVKVVRVGRDAAFVAERFRSESQILARFEHPHIGRLYDAGQTDDGRPYFVMELVVGLPIDLHCGRARLDLRGRLALFLAVCSAVSYAHGRLVVHRDIKPGNILVTATGQPKLLDFGIARLLDEDPELRARETGMRHMTPEFASPEQVRGEPASVATDVHALGLLLHVLLTGRSPRHLASLAPAELVRVICMEDPAPPSVAVTERARHPGGFEPPEASARLARLLRGDLDSIVARALRKEPEQRYRSVDALAADVQAYLDGRPVVARGGRWRYTMGRFLRRHWLPVTLAAGLVAALLGGLVTTTWQARVAQAERARSERRFADVRQLATRFLFDFHDAVRDLPGSLKAREMLVSTAREHLQRLADEAGGDPELQLELANAYRRMARVQGVPGAGNLGDVKGARDSLLRAQDLLGHVHPERREDARYGRARLQVAVELARVEQQLGAYDRALELLKQAEAEAEVLRPRARELEEYTPVARAYYELALELARRQLLAEAEEKARECLEITLEIRARWPENLDISRRLGPLYEKLGELAMRQGRYAEARRHAQDAVDLRRAAYNKENAPTARGLMSALAGLAAIERYGDMARADAAYAESITLARWLAAQDPQDSQAAKDLAAVASAWCAHQTRGGHRPPAGDVCQDALRVFEASADEQLEAIQFNLAEIRLHAGRRRELAGDVAGALQLYARALDAVRSPVLAEGGVEIAQLTAAIQLATGRAHLARQQPSEARAALHAATAILMPAVHDADLMALETLVEAHTLAAEAEDPGGACAASATAAPAAGRLRTMAAGLPHPPGALTRYEALRARCG